MPSVPLSETCGVPAALWLWPGQALYVGPSLALDIHSGSVSCLAVGVDEEFTVQLENGSRQVARTALIAARVRHRIVPHGNRMAFCYLDPASPRERACRRMMSGSAELARGHGNELPLTRLAAQMDGSTPLPAALRWLDLAGPDDRTEPRPRSPQPTHPSKPNSPQPTHPSKPNSPGPAHPTHPGQTIDCSSLYACSAYEPTSRPTPLFLKPPNGASMFRPTVFTPTPPARSCRATRKARATSPDHT